MLRRLTSPFLAPLLTLSALTLAAQTKPPTQGGDVLIKNATLLTATHGRIDHGSVYVKGGKIVALSPEFVNPFVAP